MSAVTTQSLTSLLQVGGELSGRFSNAWEKFWHQDHVPPLVLEMCRLRLAQLHGAESEISLRCVDGLSSEMVNLIRQGTYAGNSLFSSAAIAALELSEIYAQDPNAITDELTDAVKAHYGDAGLVCLIEALGFIESRIRLSLMFTGWNLTSLN